MSSRKAQAFLTAASARQMLSEPGAGFSGPTQPIEDCQRQRSLHPLPDAQHQPEGAAEAARA